MSKTARLGTSSTVVLYGKKIGATFAKNSMPEDVEQVLNDDGTNLIAALAMVHGYRHEDRVVKLPEPVTLLLPGTGADIDEPAAPDKTTQRALEVFPAAEFLEWTVRLDDPTMCFEIDESDIAAELGMAVEVDDFGAMGVDGGGFTLRGADGRLYYVPEALDTFQVLDESDRGNLLMAPGTERGDLKVRELADDGTGGEIQARAMMTGRAMIQNRAMMQSRAMMQARAMMQSRAMMQARAMMNWNLENPGHRGDDDT